MDESIIRTVSLFFYLNFFDTKQSYWASHRTLALWRSRGFSGRVELIPIAKKILNSPRSFGLFSTQKVIGQFIRPAELNLQPWLEFKRKAEGPEYEAVLLSQVLDFTDEEIALALGISEGTVRHRLSRGLRELGRNL